MSQNLPLKSRRQTAFLPHERRTARRPFGKEPATWCWEKSPHRLCGVAKRVGHESTTFFHKEASAARAKRRPRKLEHCPDIGTTQTQSLSRRARFVTHKERGLRIVHAARLDSTRKPPQKKVPQKWRLISKSLRVAVTFRVLLPTSIGRRAFPQVTDGRFRTEGHFQAQAVYFSKSSATFSTFNWKTACDTPTDPRRRGWRGR